MTTSGHSSQQQLTLCAGGSRAKTSAMPESALGSKELVADYGANTSESFARFDRDSSSWRTSQRCLFGGWIEFSGTWPPAGTMRNGECYRPANWERHTHESGCFALPTATKSDAGCGEIMCETRPDSITGKPRKINANGETWSCGLGRIFRIATGLPIHPSFSEWLMGFPTGWSELERAETQLCHKSPSGSDDV